MRLRIIDAFADRPFTGNPAAVCLLEGDDWPAEAWMREVAAEMNLPMTAFARPLRDDAEAEWGLRWFNSVIEETLCGHATLATAHALREDAGTDSSFRFSTRSGVLTTHARDGQVTLDFPAATVTEQPLPDGLAGALGAVPLTTYDAQPLQDVIALFADESAVRRLAPDYAALAAFTAENDVRGVTVTAAASDRSAGYDFVSRFFSPAHGLPEDPVTGSAHTALAPYWSERLGRDRLTALQVSPRGGRMTTEVKGDRVELTGRAVTVLDGALHG